MSREAATYLFIAFVLWLGAVVWIWCIVASGSPRHREGEER